MTRNEIKQLQIGDRVTHPAFIGFLRRQLNHRTG
jgi:hypothetical protein